MATRNVIVASAATNKAKSFETSAKTWGELRVEAGVAALITGDVEAIVNPGRHTLNRDEAELPEGDFKVYLVPIKNKAGNISAADAVALGKEIAQALVDAANKATADDVAELRNLLVSDIEDFFNVDLKEAGCVGCEEALEEAKALLS